MRKIKFRAFDKDVGEMVEDVYLSCHGITDHRGNTLFGVRVMQYTGLKDKNGVEIYEGDILLYSSGGVYFGDGQYWVPTCYDLNSRLIDCLSSVVVGNIYENPELLGGGE